MTANSTGTLVLVCHVRDLPLERGAAALVAGEQVALFRIAEREVLAVQQLDPYCGANVMSRGIVGSRGDSLTIASPMHKQVFDLRTGQCLDSLGQPSRHLRAWPTRVTEDGSVLVGAPLAPLDGSP